MVGHRIEVVCLLFAWRDNVTRRLVRKNKSLEWRPFQPVRTRNESYRPQRCKPYGDLIRTNRESRGTGSPSVLYDYLYYDYLELWLGMFHACQNVPLSHIMYNGSEASNLVLPGNGGLGIGVALFPSKRAIIFSIMPRSRTLHCPSPPNKRFVPTTREKLLVVLVCASSCCSNSSYGI